jgi:hypothetical protein
VDARQRAPDRGSEDFVGPPFAQFVLPIAVGRRIEIRHGEEAGLWIVADEWRHRPRQDASHHLHPFDLEGIALDWHKPIVGDLELGQRPLNGKAAGSCIDLPDVGGYTAGQRRIARALARGDEPHTLKRRIEGGTIGRLTHGFGHCGQD